MKLSCISCAILCPAFAFAQQGQWELPRIDFGDALHQPIWAVHLIHTFDGANGKFIALTWQDDPADPSCLQARSLYWVPPLMNAPPGTPGGFESIPLCRTDVFCAGHSALADGRVFHAGGMFADVTGPATKHADMFDPFLVPGTNWNNPVTPPDMTYERFYPTCTTLGDGRVLVTSGTLDGDTLPTANHPRTLQPCVELVDGAGIR